ncbi:MAG: AraC family transcriptional regulator [Bacteroidota bacterium]
MTEIRQEYIKRITGVLDHIEANLDVDLSLEALAQIACYSSFHFHRVFATITGENVNQYVNRKRIERIAAILLSGTDQPIKELAYAYGFNSESSFSRAFKKFYGLSPTAFSSEGKKVLRKIGIAPFGPEKYICSVNEIQKWMKMNAQIVASKLAEIKLAGIMQIGAFDKTADMYQRLMRWGHEKEILDMAAFKAITIYHDNPHVTESAKVRFSACVTINHDFKAEGEIRPLSIAAGIYALGRFEIKAEEFPRAWQSMSVWVIEQGYEFRDGDYFEIYHNDHTAHPEQKFIIDICIPLEKTPNLKLDTLSELKLPPIAEAKPNNKQQLGYHDLIDFMKDLRAFFAKEYDTTFKLGSIYKGSPDYSCLSLTTEELKKQKLKFVLILDHHKLSFSICLSGQNKSVRKKYWQMFQGSDWHKYPLVETIDERLYIMDNVLVEDPNFNDRTKLIDQIECEALKFINELRGVLE